MSVIVSYQSLCTINLLSSSRSFLINNNYIYLYLYKIHFNFVFLLEKYSEFHEVRDCFCQETGYLPLVKVITLLASVKMAKCNIRNCCSVEMCLFFQEVIVAPRIASV